MGGTPQERPLRREAPGGRGAASVLSRVPGPSLLLILLRGVRGGAARAGPGVPGPHTAPPLQVLVPCSGRDPGWRVSHPPLGGHWPPPPPTGYLVPASCPAPSAHMSHARDSVAASDALGCSQGLLPAPHTPTVLPSPWQRLGDPEGGTPALSLIRPGRGAGQPQAPREQSPLGPPPWARVSSPVPPAPCTQPQTVGPLPCDPLPVGTFTDPLSR